MLSGQSVRRRWKSCSTKLHRRPEVGHGVTADAKYVNERVAPLAKNADLSKFIL